MSSKECVRKCSLCGQSGHNSRTCNKGFKLFGVRIDAAGAGDGESNIRKSKSTGNMHARNLESSYIRKSKSQGNIYTQKSINAENINWVAAETEATVCIADGFHHQYSPKNHERKKGKPWSEEEHRSFLAGLEKLGKGDWKGIAKNFVPSRKSSQVASHAQKYYIRMAVTAEKKRRRASVFDIPLNRPYSQAVLGLSSNKVVQFSHQPSVSSWTHSFPTETVMPTFSWAPVVNFQSQSLSLSDVRGSLATYASFMSRPSLVALRQ